VNNYCLTPSELYDDDAYFILDQLPELSLISLRQQFTCRRVAKSSMILPP